MKELGLAAMVFGVLGFTAPALAGLGQCYDAYGRPVGPVYDTDHPDYNFLDAVIGRGGSCTGVSSDWHQDRGYRWQYYYHGPRRPVPPYQPYRRYQPYQPPPFQPQNH